MAASDARLYDYKTKTWTIVPAQEVGKLVSSGSHGFESGIEVPVVSPDGQIGTLPSEQVSKAFKDGYRFQTPSDVSAFEKARTEEIQKEHFDSAGNAGVEGVLRGATMGLSDVAAPQLAEAFGSGITSEEAARNLATSKENSPIAAGLGQVAGTLINPLTRMGGTAAAEMGASIVPSAATGIVGKLSSTALGSAAEGAFYGAGDGISEAALGNPSDIAEHLISGPLAGAIFGGVAGAGFEAAKMAATPLKGLIGKASETIASGTRAAMRNAAGKPLAAVLDAKGEKELAGYVRDLTAEGSEVVRDAYFNGGAEVAERLAKEVGEAEKLAKVEAKRLRQELEYEVKQRPKEIRKQIAADVDESKGNLTQALDTSFARYEGNRNNLQFALEGDQMPSQTKGLFIGETRKAAEKLGAIGDGKANVMSRYLNEYLEAQQVAAAARGGMTEGREMIVLQELRDKARAGLGSGTEEGQKVLKKYVDDMTYLLHEHPTYGKEFKNLDHYYESFDGLRSAATKVRSEPTTKVKGSILRELRDDPEKAADFDKLISNFSEVAPEMAALKGAGSNLAAKQAALRTLQEKIQTVTDRSYGRLTADDFEAIAHEFSSPKMLEKIGDIRNIQAALQAQGEGVFTKAIALKKALGLPVDSQIENFVKHEKGFDKLSKLAPKSLDDDYKSSIAKAVLKRGLGAALGGGVGFGLGDGGGAALGVTLGMGASKMVNAHNTLKMLTLLERQSNKAFKTVEAASKRAVDALTSDQARKVGVIALAQNKSLSERRKDFQARADHLTQMMDPKKRLEMIQNRIGEVPGAPKIQASLAAQVSKNADFLASKLPSDPTATSGISAFKSMWEPSDYELGQYERYQEAVENPVTVLDDIASGVVTPEGVEVLQTLYPSMYRRLQNDVLNAIIKPNTNLTYSQRIEIGSVLSIPSDATLAPQFVVAMQQNFQPPEAQQQGAQGGRPKGSTPAKMNVDSKATMTQVQRTTES